MNFLWIYAANNSQCLQVRNANGSVAMHVAVKMTKMNGLGGDLLCCVAWTPRLYVFAPRTSVILFCVFFCEDWERPDYLFQSYHLVLFLPTEAKHQ